MANGHKVLLIELFKDMPVATNGVALGITILNLDVPRFRGVLPSAASLAVFGLVTEAAAADFEFNVGFVPGFDRNYEFPNTPFYIASSWMDSAATGGVRSADYNQTANFMPEARLQIASRNKAGVTGVKNARISAILMVTLLT